MHFCDNWLKTVVTDTYDNLPLRHLYTYNSLALGKSVKEHELEVIIMPAARGQHQ